MTTRTSNRNAGDLIAERRPFKGNNLSGGEFRGMGQLHPAYDAVAVSSAEYVVYSYATPIAWFIAGSWVIPHERYSVTTSKHQNIVRNATRTTQTRTQS